MALIPREKKIKLSAASESAGEMLQENHRVMFLKLLQHPPPLLHGQRLAGGDLTEELFEVLQGGSFTLILILLWRHLLAEGECCNTATV